MILEIHFIQQSRVIDYMAAGMHPIHAGCFSVRKMSHKDG